MSTCFEELIKTELYTSYSSIKRTGDNFSGSLTIRANAPARMSFMLIIGREKDILVGAFALKVPLLTNQRPIRVDNKDTRIT